MQESWLIEIFLLIHILSHFRHVWLYATLWTIAFQAPLSMGFSGQEYWSVLPCPTPGDLPNPGAEPASPTLQEDSLPSEPPGKPFSDSCQKLNWISRAGPIRQLHLKWTNNSQILISFLLKTTAGLLPRTPIQNGMCEPRSRHCGLELRDPEQPVPRKN